MDQFFQYDSQEEMFALEAALPANHSAFVRYADRPNDGFQVKRSNNNMNKRMIESLKRNWTPVIKEADRGRCHRHMIAERMRREKQKHSYLALHSVLPPGTKGDKNSIIQIAVKQIQELNRQKKELERRMDEIEAILAAREIEEVGGAEIRLKVANPSSGIDSMVEVLKCLRNMGSKTRAIQSKFSSQELAAVVEIKSEKGAADVEMAVEKTLIEVERKFRFHF